MEARYTTNKGRLPKAMIDDMHEAYGRCELFLAIVPTKQRANAEANVAKVMLIGLGYTEEALAKVDFEDLDPQVFQDLVRRKMAASGANGPRQKVVGLQDVPLASDHKARIRAPTFFVFPKKRPGGSRPPGSRSLILSSSGAGNAPTRQ